MNHFEMLSDYPILHIFSYLSGSDLLKLAGLDRKFNRIITESRKTSFKIPLILNFRNSYALDVDEVTDLAHKRQFKTLKLKNVHKTIANKFTPLLDHLTESVEHLTITDSRFNGSQFRNLIQMFLPQLKTCDVGGTSVTHNALTKVKEEVGASHPLVSLRIRDADVLKYFVGCKQLKSFEFGQRRRNGNVYHFLSQHDHIEKLKIADRWIDFSLLKCSQLKELTLPQDLNSEDVSTLLVKLTNLTKLEVTICDRSHLQRAMAIICNASKLEDLDIQIRCKSPAIPPSPLENHTVKKLRIRDENGEVTCWLLQMFRAVELVTFPGYSSTRNFCDPSDVPLETIDKITLRHRSEDGGFYITFSPAKTPSNIERFESAVKKFTEKFAINRITIGHEKWLNKKNKDFALTNMFCEGLVNRLPNLELLELYNVAEPEIFRDFL